jgi:hypothetical protein
MGQFTIKRLIAAIVGFSFAFASLAKAVNSDHPETSDLEQIAWMYVAQLGFGCALAFLFLCWPKRKNDSEQATKQIGR